MVSSGGPGPLGPLVLRVRAIADSWRVALPTTGDGACMGGGGGAYHQSRLCASSTVAISVTSTVRKNDRRMSYLSSESNNLFALKCVDYSHHE
ncbi:hypothetical protein PVAP13_5NG170905 [Panicum virgatum]|uniref:Uncharacterized protein n=1 Tax=Panicum virgatum TaxID=38727 RepID=A0A8T0S956_PANVG|nr:hypothetical protein PVAP13_5NG170905 [Panicum virgatum]